MAMGAGAEAQVGQVAPVDEVVAAFAAGPGPVRNFVLLVARGGEQRLAALVHIGHCIVVGHGHEALLDPQPEGRVLLDDEGVAREVLGAEGDRALQRRLPTGQGLPRQAADEVEIDVVEAGGARALDGLGGLGGRVDAADGRIGRRRTTARPC